MNLKTFLSKAKDMISLSRVKEATNEFVKVLRFGKKDVKTPNHVTPHGIESKPVRGDLAVHAATTNDNETVCLGYIKNCQKVGVGETCVYATDSEGNRVFEVYLKADGTVEIGGNSDNAVMFDKLKSALDSFAAELNTKLATQLTAAGSGWPEPVTYDINDAKNNDVKM